MTDKRSLIFPIVALSIVLIVVAAKLIIRHRQPIFEPFAPLSFLEVGTNFNGPRHGIAIGRNATLSNDYELVITFTDGSELRQQLPTNKTVDLPWMKGEWMKGTK